MIPSSAHRRARKLWLRYLCRTLALVAQLLVVLVPLSEGHEDRLLGAHAEAPRSTPHPGHHVVLCAACTLVGLHGRVDQPLRLHATFVRAEMVLPTRVVVLALRERTVCNSSRAPPTAA
jgi:hypothetical protein